MNISETRLFFYCLSILFEINDSKTKMKVALKSDKHLIYGDFLAKIDYKDENYLIRKRFCNFVGLSSHSMVTVKEQTNKLLNNPYKLFEQIEEFVHSNKDDNFFIKKENNVLRDVIFLDNKEVKFDSFLFEKDSKFEPVGIISNETAE